MFVFSISIVSIVNIINKKIYDFWKQNDIFDSIKIINETNFAACLDK